MDEHPLHKWLFQRKDDIKNLTNEILNNIYNKKAKKRKINYPKENTSDDDYYEKKESPKKFKKNGWLKKNK